MQSRNMAYNIVGQRFPFFVELSPQPSWRRVSSVKGERGVADASASPVAVISFPKTPKSPDKRHD